LNIESPGFEVPLKKIFEDVSAEVADVRKIINSWPTGIKAHGAAGRIEGGEGFEGAREGIEEAQRHGGTGDLAV
jgi:hypothetical protein